MSFYPWYENQQKKKKYISYNQDTPIYLFSIGKLRVSFIFFASCISVFVFFLYPR